MSTRPEDISQDVWRTAEGHALSGLATVAFDTIEQNDAALYVLTNVIARAILAAKAEEREACAQVADDGEFDEHAIAQATDYGFGFDRAAREIAAYIRKRGEA